MLLEMNRDEHRERDNYCKQVLQEHLPKGGSKGSIEQVQAHVMFHISGLGGSLQLLQFFSRLKKYTVSKFSSVHEIIIICCCHFVFQTNQ